MSGRARIGDTVAVWRLRADVVAKGNMRRRIQILREPDGPVAFYHRERFKSRDA